MNEAIEQPLVTVVIASYNHAPYVEASIRSVIQQTYHNIELLVVDDGSSDDSVERIRRLQEKFGFDFRAQKNIGLTRTLNEAIARARGEYFVPFGSDDIMMPNRIELQVAYMADKPEVGICAGNMELMRADGTLYPESKQNREIPFRRLDFEDVLLQRKPFPPAPTLFFRKEALVKVGGFNPEIRLEDLYIELKITHAGYFIDALGVVLAKYRKHPTNTYKNTRFMAESILRIYTDYADHPCYEAARCRHLNSMFLKSANVDRQLAREMLSQLPLREWNRKTLRGLLRYFGPMRRRA